MVPCTTMAVCHPARRIHTTCMPCSVTLPTCACAISAAATAVTAAPTPSPAATRPQHQGDDVPVASPPSPPAPTAQRSSQLCPQACHFVLQLCLQAEGQAGRRLVHL